MTDSFTNYRMLRVRCRCIKSGSCVLSLDSGCRLEPGLPALDIAAQPRPRPATVQSLQGLAWRWRGIRGGGGPRRAPKPMQWTVRAAFSQEWDDA